MKTATTPIHRSPGAMAEILCFLPKIEALRCQQLNGLMYQRLVARSSTRFRLARPARVDQPQVLAHNAAQKVWVVADFLEEIQDAPTGLGM